MLKVVVDFFLILVASGLCCLPLALLTMLVEYGQRGRVRNDYAKNTHRR